MKGNLYTLVYSAVLGLVCAGLLTGVSWALDARKNDNIEAYRVRNVLTVLGVPPLDQASPPRLSAQQLLQMKEKFVRERNINGIPAYEYVDESGQVQSVAVHFQGQGLWGPVKGYLSLAGDMRTIRGVTFYHHEETPGLGGEIQSDRFRQQFRGKKIVDAAGQPGLIIRQEQSGDLADNEVMGITGATLTDQKVQAMLNDLIVRLVPAQSGPPIQPTGKEPTNE